MKEAERINDKSLVEYLASCPVCGMGELAEKRVPVIKIGAAFFDNEMLKFGLTKCRECGLEFVNPRPSPELLAKFYDTLGYPAHDATERSITARSTNLFRLGLIKDNNPAGARLLDYGCGSGCFALLAKESGWNAVGVEPSMVGRKSTLNLGIEVYGGIEELPGGSYYDVVTMFHVLEHVSSLDNVLGLAHAILAESGLLVIEVPNIRSLRALIVGLLRIGCTDDERYRSFPIHLYGFDKKTLTRLLVKHGFSVVRSASFYIGKTFTKENGAASVKSISGAGDRRRSWPFAGFCWLKNMLKALLFSFSLGENLVVVASRAKVRNSVSA